MAEEPSVFQEYLTATEAAKEIDISYDLLMARTRKGKIAFIKKGWSLFIHRDEVAREKCAEAERRRARDAGSQGVEEPAG